MESMNTIEPIRIADFIPAVLRFKQQGWHVVYFQSWGDPVWKNTIVSSFRSDDISAWLEEIREGLEATRSSGINHV